MRIAILACSLVLSAGLGTSPASAHIPIPPAVFGSNLTDYEIAVGDMAAELPIIDPEAKDRELVEPARKVRETGVAYLQMLALARADQIAIENLLFSEDSEKIVTALTQFVRPGQVAGFTNHPLNAETLLEIARQRLDLRSDDPQVLRDNMALATFALRAMGRDGESLSLASDYGLDIEDEARRAATGGGGVAINLVQAHLAEGNRSRAVEISRMILDSVPESEFDRRLGMMFSHAYILMEADRHDEAGAMLGQIADLDGIEDLIRDRAMYQRTLVLLQGEKFAAAERSAREQLRMAPGDRSITGQLADSLLGQDKVADILALFDDRAATERTLISREGPLGPGTTARMLADKLARYYYRNENWPALRELVAQYEDLRGKSLSQLGGFEDHDWLSLAAARLAAEEGTVEAVQFQFAFGRAARDKDRERYDEAVRLYRTRPDQDSPEGLQELLDMLEVPGVLLPENDAATNAAFAGQATREMLSSLQLAMQSGLSPAFPREVVTRRMADARKRIETDVDSADQNALGFYNVLQMVRGKWRDALELQLDIRRKLAGSRDFSSSERRDFYLECPPVVEVYRRLVPDGDEFDDFAQCDFEGLEKGLPGFALASFASMFGTDPSLAVDAMTGDLTESLVAEDSERDPRMGLASAISRTRSNRRQFSQQMVDLLWRRDGNAATSATRAQVFELLQWANLGVRDDAIIRGAAERLAASIDPELVDLTREYKTLSQVLSRMPDPVQAPRSEEERARQAEYARQERVEREQQEARSAEIRDIIEAKFPTYFDFIQPRALSVAEARERIAPDEALVIAHPTGDFVHMLVIDDSDSHWFAAPISRFELSRRVQRLLWDLSAPVNVTDDIHDRWVEDGGDGFPFARELSHDLYNKLLGPAEPLLEGKRRIYVSAMGELSGLPFGVLVTSPPRGKNGNPQDLRDTDWLADRHAIVNLPSISSLRLLERSDGRSRPSVALAGFGNPVLAGESSSRGVAGRTRNRGIQRGGGSNDPSLPLVERLRSLDSLPGTQIELEAIQATLGAPSSALALQERATETAVRERDLSEVSILAFATHGVMPVELEGLSEPGLVFTPPRAATDTDNGILTSSEIALLKLNADWVLLSACNTAVGSGAANLTDSFFFAGARSVLASHWYVDDQAAAALTSKAIAARKADPSLTRAEALQLAMREVRLDASHDQILETGQQLTWAHPSIWAPFSVYGDVDTER